MGGSGTAFRSSDTPDGYNERRVRETALKHVDKYMNHPFEHGYAIGLDGTILDEGRDGTNDMCEIVNAQNAITIHNHPDGGVPSPQDIRMVGSTNGYMMICYDRSRMYILRKMNWGKSSDSLFGDAKDYRDFARDYEKSMLDCHNRAIETVRQMAYRGEVKNNKECREAGFRIQNDEMRTWLRNHAKEYGYEYLERTHKK